MTDKDKPKSPWSGLNASPEEKAALEKLDQKIQDFPPPFTPTEWKGMSEDKLRRLAIANCGINHILELSNLSIAERVTYLAEKLGSVIGDECSSPDQVTTTIALFSAKIVNAGRQVFADKQQSALIDRLFSQMKGPH